MVDVIVNDGLDYFEDVAVDPTYSEVLDTIAVGDGTDSPSLTDSSLTNNLYEATTVNGNITVGNTANTGEIRATIELTGGTEVPADSSITEFAIKASDGTLVYYEVRSSGIDFPSGQTKIIELRLIIRDEDTETDTAFTDTGRNLLRDIALGDTTDKFDTIAVGSSTNNVSQTDTTMFDQKFEASDGSSQVTAETTTNVGEPEFLITISAGADASDEVAADTDISEFGIEGSSGQLVYHETRNTVTLEANDSKTFDIPLIITQ